MVATTSEGPPPLESVRCVAKSFCRPAEKAPVKLWDDSGAGGKAASMWMVNSTQALWVAARHGAPRGTFWELAAESITFSDKGRPSVHRVHQDHEHPAPLASPAKEAASEAAPRASPGARRPTWARPFGHSASER
ncbi:unnamed protein product [Prorocentrum cordatum]|uniref:Uncharacterized protein n=1 Tax=Prorocentrum cordatum TaxID=2364126 RepID=A0ABN9V712_9DINO|nr:unnamed protein product [Polarella glacialis]